MENLHRYFRIWNSLNTLLTKGNFVEKGVYDSIHLTFGIQKDEQERLQNLNQEIRKLVSMLGLIYNVKGRNYWLMEKLRDRIVSYQYKKQKSNIHGEYDDLFQIRTFSLIAGLDDTDFLITFIEYCSTIIKKGKKSWIKLDLKQIEEIITEIITEDLGWKEKVTGDEWLHQSSYKLNPSTVSDKKPFLTSFNERKIILDCIKQIMRNRITGLQTNLSNLKNK